MLLSLDVAGCMGASCLRFSAYGRAAIVPGSGLHDSTPTATSCFQSFSVGYCYDAQYEVVVEFE